MKIEKTTVKLHVDKKLNLSDAQAVRGFFRSDVCKSRSEFHSNDNSKELVTN